MPDSRLVPDSRLAPGGRLLPGLALLLLAGCGMQQGVLSGAGGACFATAANRLGAADGALAMDRMILLLRPAAEQQQALDALAAAQQDPASPEYRRWLTPAEYGEEFGASAETVGQVEAWLEGQGFRVEQVAANRRMIVFSGTVAEVDAAFHAQMSRYAVAGAERVANGAAPVFPAELQGAIVGIAGLAETKSVPLHHAVTIRAGAAPAFASGGAEYLAPGDIAAIYDASPLYAEGMNGSGETIAVLTRSDVIASDVAAFRSSFGLAANAPVVVNGSGPDTGNSGTGNSGTNNPGTGNEADLDEAELDAEWAGAVAPEATVEVVASASTATMDGVVLSAEYAVDHDVAPVIALSYGECEAEMGPQENALLNALWEQAAVEGISVVVAAGDSGAADCDAPSTSTASGGDAVNGMCSSPYSLCVGGTELTGTGSGYWSSQNGGSGGSALGYIPETAWNESGNGGLWAGGGGVSALYARPAWQPASAGGGRAVPDVALTSAIRNPYLVWLHGAQMAESGTSAAAQVMAGLLALVAESQGTRLGNAGPALYGATAAKPAAFHDVTTGNNSVPGVTGYDAGPGYDAATGLGSVDVTVLAHALGGRSTLKQQPCRLLLGCEKRRAGPRHGPAGKR